MEDAGTADRRERHVAPPQPGLIGERSNDLAELRDERLRAPHPSPFVPPDDDLSCEVRQRSADPRPAYVDPDDPAGTRVQLVQDGARTLPAGRPAGLARQPRGRQGRERLRDRRLRQTGGAGDLRPRDRTSLTDGLEHDALVDRAKQSRRADRNGSARTRRSPPPLQCPCPRVPKESFLTIPADATLVRAGESRHVPIAASEAMRTPDVIALGETMLSLVAADGALAESHTLHVTFGGAEAN